MSELRFDDRVAIVTGGGRGLGRAYALLLASKGAKVVVNDVGVNMHGEAIGETPAQDVVNEIKAAGGDAVASLESVATVGGGKAILDLALDTWGRIDVLIPNAGNVRYGELDEISQEDFEGVLNVHLHGAWNLVRPAFPVMKAAGYGRVVLTSSISGLYGNQRCVNYGMSKTSMIGLNNVIGIEGAEHDIKSNIIIPAAVTRMSEGLDVSQFPPMDPDLVAAVVGWLAHQDCSITGEMLISAAGRVARAFFTETEGVFKSSWTVEQVGAEIDAIRNPDKQWTFQPVPSGMGEHLGRSFEMARQG